MILEYKKKSPSKGLLRKNFNLKNIIKIYNQYASAISVLTDEKYFNGSFNFINQIKNYTKLPLLCKDFIIDDYQIYLARYHGANAILLILSILNDNQYVALSNVAHDLNMDVLTEVSNSREVNRAIKLKAKIIGINNRNLKDLSIDINRTFKLAKLINFSVITISESGISNYNQVKKLKKIVNGFLIGSSVMKEKNISIGIKKIIFGKNKVCGLTNTYDAFISEKFGAIYGGLIFCNDSLRKITLNQAKKIVQFEKIIFVGVFCNAKIKDVVLHTYDLNLNVIQLHGNENQIYINKLKSFLPKYVKIWKAVKIKNYLPKIFFKNIKYYIFDSFTCGKGIPFDWSILKKIDLSNTILAGGINYENCIKALKTGCIGLDLNSGVEKTPGIKDEKKIQMIFKKIKNM
ncbi:bifunctional indole-3-glycerol-phosphate synthase TrpC/phosphoribosylanthranilate isomerase TrpF [Buchnera aphidicola (Taiwanaphis decaspermi)]